MFPLLALSIIVLTGCSSSGTEEQNPDDLVDKNLDQIMAVKTPFALTKSDTPLLNTPEWDQIFGGDSGSEPKYDQYGEIDELVFVAAPGTELSLQRQVRKNTRIGTDTIYYKVTTPVYKGDEELWVDGRFLNLTEVRPQMPDASVNNAHVISRLRSYESLPFTWHGSSADGAPELLEYYPPAEEISLRTKNDWILKGFDSLGMIYRASEGQTPLDYKSLARFGESVFADLSQDPSSLPSTDPTPDPEAVKSPESSDKSPSTLNPEPSTADEGKPSEESTGETAPTNNDPSSTEAKPAEKPAESPSTLNPKPSTENGGDPILVKAQRLMKLIKPLDIIQMGDRVWIVLDKGEVVESRYRSKFDGSVQISSLLDAVYGLLSKGVFVKDPFEELENKQAKKFFIRRWANTDELLSELLMEAIKNGEEVTSFSTTTETVVEEK